MAAKLLETNNYGLFELVHFNRDVKKIKLLIESMKKHGFIDAYPLHVHKIGEEKLKIKAGNHRFTVARMLNIWVKYVICNDNATIHELERSTNKWSMNDYLTSYCREGKKEYSKVKDYCDLTGISVYSAISMLSGQSAGSKNVCDKFKDGYFQVIPNHHSETIKDLVLCCKKHGIGWAHNDTFVCALSKSAWAKGFNPAYLKKKISSFHNFIEKQPNLNAYMDMIQSLYNRQSQNKVPLKFLAEQAAQDRSVRNKS